AKAAMEGVQLVDDALFFCANYANKGSWIEANRAYAETIGNHVFYY
ncbi:MAG: cell wall hydrolase, partial [Clostridia bacterium]|nr:cell wall hydrolase [Clostridia bacterium]